jgi:hypothetical protein
MATAVAAVPRVLTLFPVAVAVAVAVQRLAVLLLLQAPLMAVRLLLLAVQATKQLL